MSQAPPQPPWSYRAPVRFTHTDPAGYVFFPRFFEMFQAAVEDWFNQHLGIDYAGLILRERIGFPTAHTECDFLRPCRLGERLELQLWLERVGGSSFCLRFDGRVGAQLRLRARSVLVTISMHDGRPRPLPPALRERLHTYHASCLASIGA